MLRFTKSNWFMAVATLCAVDIVIAAKATAQFSTIINVPPDAVPSSLESNTQLNVLDGGLLQVAGQDFQIGDIAGTSTNVELNLMGGRIFAGGSLEVSANAGSRVNISGGVFHGSLDARSGSVVNMSGGLVETFILSENDYVARSGSTFVMTGGYFADALRANQGSDIRISGGGLRGLEVDRATVTLSGGALEFLDIEDGSSVTLQGGDFRLNGSPIPGTSDIGSMVNLQQPLGVGDTLSGVLADGTSFVFANLPDGRSLEGNIPALHTVEIPPIVPRSFVVSTDGNPGGIRAGQSLVVDAPLSPIPFTALPGSTVDVVAGGSVGRMQAFEATVNVDAGIAGTLVAIDSDVHITGGRGANFAIYNDSQVRMSGGEIRGLMRIDLGSDAVVTGGSIRDLDIFGDSTAQIKGGVVTEVLVGAGGLATISGGSVEGLIAQPNATLHLVGKQFFLNDVPVPDLSPGSTLEILRRDATLSGVLVDGSTFSLPLFHSTGGGHIRPGFPADATLLVTVVPEPSCWLLLGWLGATVGLRCRHLGLRPVLGRRHGAARRSLTSDAPK